MRHALRVTSEFNCDLNSSKNDMFEKRQKNRTYVCTDEYRKWAIFDNNLYDVLMT